MHMLKTQLCIIIIIINTTSTTSTTITTTLGVHSDKCTEMNSSTLFTV
jgi:hypothetical protein